MTLAELNALDRDAFVAALGGIFEHSPWVAADACAARPFASVAALHEAMVAAMYAAAPARQLDLMRAHPELAGQAAIRGELTAASRAEQAGAGLSACTPAQYAALTELNDRYRARFGFPFILAVAGYDRAGVIGELARRVERTGEEEFAENLRQIARIAALRLAAQVQDPA